MEKTGLRGRVYDRYVTAADMARQMGWGRQKLHRIMSGKQIPTVADLADLSRALESPIGEIAHLFLRNQSPIEQQYLHIERGARRVGR